MVLSNKIQQIIKQNLKDILSDVPFKDILISLYGVRILGEKEVDKLQQCNNHESAGYNFLKILNSRNDTDFLKFCDILINNHVDHIKKIGLLLKNATTDKEEAQGQSNLALSVVST